MSGVWLGILGPLRVVSESGSATVTAGKQRVILAALMVRAGQAVRWDELAEFVWDGAPPKHARVALRNYVMRLRNALGRTAGSRIVTRGHGYVLEAAENEVDTARFVALCRSGGDAVRVDWSRARHDLRDALTLWRGEPFVDIPSETLRREEVPRLEQWHLQAWEWRIETDLRLGCHEELLPELAALADQHPLRERFHAQLMLALHRSGRQAEALSIYQRIRRRLADELGVDPCRELRVAHQQVLTGDVASPLT